MKILSKILIITIIVAFIFSPEPLQVSAQSTEPVTVVLFISTSCPHCHNVLENTITPIINDGEFDLQVILINISNGGVDIFQNTVDSLQVPANLRGTPFLVIGDSYMVGDKQIPEELPQKLIESQTNESYLFPQVPGIDDLSSVNNIPGAIVLDATNINYLDSNGYLTEIPETSSIFWGWESALICLMIILLFLTIIAQIVILIRKETKFLALLWTNGFYSRIFKILLFFGLVIAAYLSYTEMFDKDTICLGLSGCDIVQRSSYAHLFGFIPVALTGFLCFSVLILMTFLYPNLRLKSDLLKKFTPLSVFCILLLNNLFLLALNFLELLELKALCIWCWTFALTNILLTWIIMYCSKKFKA